VAHSCLSAQVPARVGKATAVAAPLFSFESRAKLWRTGRRVKASCGWGRRTEGKPRIAISTREWTKTSAADDAVNPTNLGTPSPVGGPVTARSPAETLEHVATDVVVRCVERSQADATGSPERPSTPVQMACVADPGVIRHQMRALIGAECAQRKGWLQKNAAWISGKGHVGTVDGVRRVSTETGCGDRSPVACRPPICAHRWPITHAITLCSEVLVFVLIVTLL
jgi:hypothetical protein